MSGPPLAVTLGDVCGVGPEIALRAHVERRIAWPYVLIGNLDVLERCNAELGIGATLQAVDDLQALDDGTITVLDPFGPVATYTPGRISEDAGRAAYAYLERGIAAVQAGDAAALVTLPVNKEAIRLSVPTFTGHTDVIAAACGVSAYSQSLATEALVVTHLSSHLSLRDAIDAVTQERVEAIIRITDDAVRRMGFNPRIAVMGLNPHAGENGAFGREEIEIIAPAVRAAQQCMGGHSIVGPLPPDTVFMRALKGEFGGVVCMYHDQGHIPMKTIGMDNAVNIALGLPIVRTSVDHGTAFDIAWQGRASISSYVQACDLAARLATSRR